MSFLQHNDDAMSIAPEFHKVIFEDDRVRVLEVTVPAGARAAMHWHPRNINYVLAAGTLTFTRQGWTATEVVLTPGQVTNSGELSHVVENTSDSEVKTVQVEFKD